MSTVADQTAIAGGAPRAVAPKVTVGALLWKLRYLYSIMALVLVWEFFTEFGFIDPFLLPPLSSVFKRGVEEISSGAIFPVMWETIYRTLISLALATVLGVAIGAAMRVSGIMRWFWEPVVSFMFPIPKIAFMPIFVLWFGVFDLSKIIMTTFACIVPIISATYLGTRNIDNYLIWSARGMGTSKAGLFRKVIIPAALPSIFSGIQIALPLCLIVSVVTEMMTGGRGLGAYMIFSTRFGESDKVFFGIFVTAALGFLLIEAIRRLRTLALPWHAEAEHGQ
jgi:taurine transport system permease protein